MTADVSLTILDGGLSREIVAQGGVLRQPEWSALALMEQPDAVARAHAAFAAAGAEVTTTNAYALVPFHLGDAWTPEHARALAQHAGRLARDNAGGGRVAGCLPPPLGSYRPDAFDAAEAARILAPLVEGQADHVDLWLAETISSSAEARGVAAALSGSERPVWMAFTLDDRLDGPPVLRSGEAVGDAVAVAGDLGAAAVLFNCSRPEVMEAAVRIAAGAGVETGAYANAFAPAHDDGALGTANETLHDVRRDLSPDAYATFAERWVDAGATIVGGCCGIGAAHIAALRDRLRP